MKLTIVSHAYAVPENRTIWQQLAALHPEYQVTVIIPAHWSTDRYGPQVTYTPESEQRANYEVLPLPLSQGRFRHYVGLAHMLRERQPDILYVAQERYDWSTMLALAACKTRLPCTKTIGGSTVNIEYRIRWPHHYLKEKAFFALCNGIVAMNTEAEKLLRRHGYDRPVLVQHGIGADEALWKPSSRLNSEQPLRIGFVGTLAVEKGIADLLAACAGLKGSWQLNLVGDGPERKSLENLTQQLGLKEHVVFAGFVSRKDIAPLFQSWHVLALPSRTTPTWKEQFGLVLAEAMLSGTAVVGSDSGAIPEVIGDAGVIFPEGDVAALTRVLQHLADDPAYRQSLAERGRQRALQYYSTAALAQQFSAFCTALVETKNA
ncbi:MAG TPA: glycosyltransferase family 4 protein [Aggregatilineaceae bacterium]|nr:glycosyltransferase family 4 protein [Aggregatilineaceae bacterium]